MPRLCSVANCRFKQLPLFEFPSKEHSFNLKLGSKLLVLEQFLCVGTFIHPIKQADGLFICSGHFKKDSLRICKNNMRKLKPNSIPTNFAEPTTVQHPNSSCREITLVTHSPNIPKSPPKVSNLWPSQREVTFTPRLLLTDLKGTLGTLPERGDLYDDPLNPSKVNIDWQEDKVNVQTGEPSSQKNEFLMDLENAKDLPSLLALSQKPYNLNSAVSVWSDYLYTKFHPRTVNIVNKYQHCNENTPFDAFPLGTSLWKTTEFEDDFCDKIRNYIEECNRPQGFYVLTDATSAFSGLSSACLEYLQDEYERKSILTFPLIPSHFSDNNFETDEERHQSILNDSVRLINLTLGFNSFSQHSSLFIPLCTGESGWRQPGGKRLFYHTEYNHELPYHSSAILAAALDTFTLNHRLKSSNFSLVDLCADLNVNGRKACAASVCLPFSFNRDADLIDCLDNWEGPLSQSLTPRCTIGSERIMQHITLRGIPEERLKKPQAKAGRQKDLPAYKCNSVNEMLSYYLACTTHATASNVTVVRNPMTVRSPYPLIFDKNVGINGNICVEDRPTNIRVDSVPMLAGLHSTPGIGDMLESLHTEARKVKFGRFSQFSNGGIERDEFEECLDKVFELRENYEDNYLI